MISRHCPICGEERRFEQPPCVDDHGADCPEWACTECGAAMLIGLPTAQPAATCGSRAGWAA